MDLASRLYEETIKKYQELIESLQRCLTLDDYHRANGLVEIFRQYKSCIYCQSYRNTLEEVGWDGVCGKCPLHRFGEKRMARKIGYNGCYKIGEYRNMVKNIFWLRKDESGPALKAVIESMKILLDHMLKERMELINEG